MSLMDELRRLALPYEDEEEYDEDFAIGGRTFPDTGQDP